MIEGATQGYGISAFFYSGIYSFSLVSIGGGLFCLFGHFLVVVRVRDIFTTQKLPSGTDDENTDGDRKLPEIRDCIYKP